MAGTDLVADGFAVLRRFVSPDEIAACRDLVADVLGQSRSSACWRPHNTLVPLRWDDPVVARLLSARDRVRRLAECVDAADLRWISGYVSVKDPHSPPLWWHQDWWCWAHPISYQPAAPQVAVLCYLTDVSEDNGAPRVLPRTHRDFDALHLALPAAQDRDVMELGAAHPAMRDHEDQLTLRLSAGDAVVIDYRLLHGTHGNTTSVRRDCVLLNFAPAWGKLPPEIRAHLISHLALPAEDEPKRTAPWQVELLPAYAGVRRDLPVSRVPQRRFW